MTRKLDYLQISSTLLSTLNLTLIPNGLMVSGDDTLSTTAVTFLHWWNDICSRASSIRSQIPYQQIRGELYRGDPDEDRFPLRFTHNVSPFTSARCVDHLFTNILSLLSFTKSPLLCMRTSYNVVTAASCCLCRRSLICSPARYWCNTSACTPTSAVFLGSTLPPLRFCRCALTLTTRRCSCLMCVATSAMRAVALYRFMSKQWRVHNARLTDWRTGRLA